MTETEANDLREWACGLVGWAAWTLAPAGRRLLFAPNRNDEPRSDADLAEEVRAWFMQSDIGSGKLFDPASMWKRLGWVMLDKGPLAFLRAVREVIDG